MKCLGNFVCGTDAADSVPEPDIKQTNQDTMKGLANRFRNALSILLFAGAMSLNSCQEPEVLQPELMINDTEVTVPGTGGIAEVGYTLTNPADGAEWSAEKDQDWISAFDFSEDGVIKISVDPNYVEEPREATVTVYYSEIEQGFTVKVIQEAGTPLQPVITLDQEEVEVSGKGGEVIVKYEVENPVAGAELSVEYDCDWITGLDTSVDGEIRFDVALHYVAEPRETVLTIKYDEITMSLPVKQLEGDPQDAFQLIMHEVTSITATIKVIPADSVMTYTVIPTEKEYYESFASSDDFIQKILQDYSMIAGIVGLSFEDFMEQQILATKTCYWTKDQLIPGCDYLFLVVGMDSNGTTTTEALLEYYTTPLPEDVDVTFTLEVVPDVLSAKVTTTPSRDDVQYYTEVKLLSDMPSGENMTRDDFQSWVNMKIWQGSVMGKTPQQVVEEIVAKGETTKEYLNLSSETDYVAMVAALDPNGVVISDVEAVEFKTMKVGGSSNTFDVTITAETAAFVVDVVPSINEDQYTVILADIADCEGMTDEEYAAYQANNLFTMWNSKTGPATLRLDMLGFIYKLTSDTDYKIFVFGLLDGVVTTPVSSYLVRTLPQENPSTFTAEMTVSDIVSNGARLDITVNQQTTLYIAGFVPAEFTEEQTTERIDIYANRLIDKEVVDTKARFMGYYGARGDINDGRAMYMINESGYLSELEPNKQYKPYVVAVDDKTAEYAKVIFGDTFTTSAGNMGAPRIIMDDFDATRFSADFFTKGKMSSTEDTLEPSFLLGKLPKKSTHMK